MKTRLAPPIAILHGISYNRSSWRCGMTQVQFARLSTAKVKRIALRLGFLIPRDYTKADMVDVVTEALGSDKDNPIGWRLLDQHLEGMGE